MISETVSEPEFQAALNNIIEKIHQAARLSEIMPSIEADLLSLLNAQRITVYQKSKND
jgi:hypothetical protein